MAEVSAEARKRQRGHAMRRGHLSASHGACQPFLLSWRRCAACLLLSARVARGMPLPGLPLSFSSSILQVGAVVWQVEVWLVRQQQKAPGLQAWSGMAQPNQAERVCRHAPGSRHTVTRERKAGGVIAGGSGGSSARGMQ